MIDGFRLVSVAYELQKVFFIESFLRIKVSMTDMTTWESSGEPLPQIPVLKIVMYKNLLDLFTK